MPNHDIHKRLIAGLEELRLPEPLKPHQRKFNTILDIAINNAQRQCPFCGDTGLHTAVSTTERRGQGTPMVTVKCNCNRPALLTEWESGVKG